jgi:hypothetical protein
MAEKMNYKSAGTNKGRKPSAAGAQSKPGSARARGTMTGKGSMRCAGAMEGDSGTSRMRVTGVMGK